MAKGRGKKRRPPSTPPPVAPPPKVAPFWKRCLAAFGAVILGVWAYYGFGNGVRSIIDDTTPQIRLNTAEQQVPFALPFAVQNVSDWFDMRETRFACFAVKVEFENNSGLANIGLMMQPKAVNIERRSAPANFRCGIDSARSIPLRNARIRAELSYKTMWIERHASREFNWIAGRWVEGQIY
ncbi:MAG: hypothetical protein Q7T73_00540 [Beijerinckiaceae bacterium]|nr:hypothetical protein [Beijerinckiaceae bacterium]